MASLFESRFFHRALTIDDISKKPNCKNLKFKRAFQFLQLLLIQRVYGIDVITCATGRKSSKHSQREQHQQGYQVFLGGSCNPTTWRHDQAIPYFQSRAVSYFNPQVADWTPDLVEIEHRAKELAPLLFFVIDHDTRALAAIVEVCYLAARGRSIIVVMNPIPDKKHTKFLQQKDGASKNEDEKDYENVCEARRTMRILLQSISVPIFDNVRLALECAAFILETTKRTVTNHSMFNESDDGDRDVLTPLPMSPGVYDGTRPTPVVVIRSLSNKTVFDSPAEFYQQMHQSEMARSSPIPFHGDQNFTLESNGAQFRPVAGCTRTQMSCSTNESDDDGYGSLSSSNRTRSMSSSSSASEPLEFTADQQRDECNPLKSHDQLSSSMLNNLISTFYSYVPFTKSRKPSDSSVTQSMFVLFTLPFRFIKDTLLSPIAPSQPPTVSLPSVEEPVQLNSPLSLTSLRPTHHLFDLYIASSEHDECWLNTFALPTLEQVNVTYTKRQSYHENDQLDALYDIHVRKQSRVLYYLINGSERLSHLATELAFLIGERKHHIIVYLQTAIDDNSTCIMSACERRDIRRSRAYLEDLARKEDILLSYSREQSWQHILSFFRQDD